MSDDEGALARCVGDVHRFRTTVWGRRPEHRRSGSSFGDLLDVDDVERSLVLLARRPGFRLVSDGASLPIDSYTTSTRFGGRVVEQVADVDKVLDLVHGGATLVLQGLQRTWLPLARFCDALQAAISHPVQANAYLSPARAAAFTRHVDQHAVLALQVAGQKHWRVDGLGEVEMEPGDVLYLPAGTPHEARSTATFSLHLTIGVLEVTARHVLHRALGGDGLARPLPLGFALPQHRDETAAAIAAALTVATELLDGLGVDDIIDAEIALACRRRRPLPAGRLRVAVDPTTVRNGSVLRRLRTAHVDSDGDRATIEFDGRQLQLPGFARPALDAVASADEVTVGSLPGLDIDSQLVLARRLVREGLLARASTDGSAGTGGP
ncbi:MAG: JmjC domain-containing protein [Ilumatobacteraceae bacterium]